MLAQALAITRMNLANLASRWDSSSVIVIGIGGVVAVLVAILSVATGFAQTLQSTAVPERGLVLRDGSSGEMNSNVTSEAANIIASFDGVVETAPELYVVADVPKRDNLSPANLVVRGVVDASFRLRDDVRIVEGRRFEPGRAELIVGRNAAHEFANMEIGGVIDIRNTDFKVVGIFESGGSVHESEIWTDLPMAQTAFRRGGSMTSMRVLVDRPDRFAGLQERIAQDPRLDLRVTTEEEFYREQSEGMQGIITGFGYAVATIMAVGAVFAALNTMYTAVSVRTVEIATLRAIGFGATPVVVSVIIESLALALLGGVAGGLLVYLVLDGATSSTLNNASFSQVAYQWRVTPQLLELGLMWALTLGLIGGLFPAVRAARLPITTALRGE